MEKIKVISTKFSTYPKAAKSIAQTSTSFDVVEEKEPVHVEVDPGVASMDGCESVLFKPEEKVDSDPEENFYDKLFTAHNLVNPG